MKEESAQNSPTGIYFYLIMTCGNLAAALNAKYPIVSTRLHFIRPREGRRSKGHQSSSPTFELSCTIVF